MRCLYQQCQQAVGRRPAHLASDADPCRSFVVLHVNTNVCRKPVVGQLHKSLWSRQHLQPCSVQVRHQRDCLLSRCRLSPCLTTAMLRRTISLCLVPYLQAFRFDDMHVRVGVTTQTAGPSACTVGRHPRASRTVPAVAAIALTGSVRLKPPT